MKLPSLWDSQINKVFEHNIKYGGAINRLALPTILKNKFWVLNMDDKNKDGTHWVLLWNCDSKRCYYMDPFGAPPPENVKDLILKTKKQGLYNDIDLQDLNSESCGWMCIYFASELAKKRQFLDILMDDFTMDPKLNEQLLIKYFTK